MSLTSLIPMLPALLLIFSTAISAVDAPPPGQHNDPFLAYEQLDAPDILDWVEKENSKTTGLLQSDPRYDTYRQFILDQLNSEDRLVVPSIYRDTDVVLNFWRDAVHPQGIVRRSTLTKFFAGAPDWETVLDFDALSAAEGKTWVYSGTSRLFNNYRHVMIGLSDGGKDAAEYREFDYGLDKFVKDGFFLPESKSRLTWFDRDTLLLADAVSEEDRTESGYPSVVKVWKRGVAHSDAPELYRCEKTDLSVAALRYGMGDDEPIFVVSRQLDFYNSQRFIYDGDTLTPILIPDNSELLGFHKGRAFLWLKSDWETMGTTHKQDSLIHFPAGQLTEERKDIETLYAPQPESAFLDVDITDEYVYISTLENVRTTVRQYRLESGADNWTSRRLPLGDMDSAGIASAPRSRGFVLFIQSGFTRPAALYRIDEATFEKKLIQTLPEKFDPNLYTVGQEFAVSADGTRVPYFIVHGKNTVLNGDNPVLQYGYGGFLNSLLPGYSPAMERCWLRDGGVYVMANIRGGGEYGPSWHEQAVKTNRHKAFEDFIAVSEDLIQKGYTRPGRLGIEGGSNGGLLVGAVMTMRPDLYNAAVVAVPLLDMLRYHLLPPGASWIGEYGNPEIPEEGAALRAYSPYHNLRPGVDYPVPFIVTSTKDDRVHPGHARKFTKRLEQLGKTFLYYEELDGGHSGNANASLTAKREAMKWVYLHNRLMDDRER